MLRVLFIDDEEMSVRPAVKWISDKIPAVQCEVKNFVDAEKAIEEFRPDIVVLDLLQGALSENQLEGIKTYDFIWKERFCPIVVYSARPDVIDERREQHPFVKSVQKGKDSPAQVEMAIVALKPHVQAIREAEEHVRQQFAVALREVAPYAFSVFSEADQQTDAILRCGRRRLAAQMDDQARTGSKLASWEQYLYPPVSDDLKLGDVIRLVTGKDDAPETYRLVLTPSCDMVTSGGKSPKVTQALVGRCCAPKEGLRMIGLGDAKRDKLKDRLPSTMLTPGYCESVIPLPALEGRIPHLMVNLRDLEFIPLTNIGSEGKEFIRVASIDSPFRELVSWAYMSVACRPGLPVRDFDEWCDDIVAATCEPKKV